MDAAYRYEREQPPQVPPAHTPSSGLTDPAMALAWLDTELPNLLIAARHATKHDQPAHLLHLSTILHSHLRTRGHYHDAETLHQTALTAACAVGDQAGQLNALNSLGDIHVPQGRYEQAADHYRQALQIARTTGHRPGELTALTNLGHTHRQQDRYAQAADHYKQVLDLARASGDRNWQFEAWRGLGRLSRATGDPDLAIAHLEQALTIADELSQPVDQARAHDGLAHAHHALHRRQQAREHWQHALGLLTDLGVDHTEDEETTTPSIRTNLTALGASNEDQPQPGHVTPVARRPGAAP